MGIMSASNSIIDRLVAICRSQLTDKFFLVVERTSIQVAEYAAPAGALIGFSIGVVGAIKLDSFFIFLSGTLWVIAVAISYYIGSRFSERCRRVIDNSGSTLGSAEFLDVFALLFICGAAFVLGAGVYWAIEMSSLGPLKWSVPIAAVFLLYTTLLLNPVLISTELRENATGGQDALAISLLLYKAGVRQAGIVFGIGSLIGSLLLANSLFNLFGDDGEYALFGGFQSISGVLILVAALIFPFLIYLIFIFVYLIVDICRAILTLNSRSL